MDPPVVFILSIPHPLSLSAKQEARTQMCKQSGVLARYTDPLVLFTLDHILTTPYFKAAAPLTDCCTMPAPLPCTEDKDNSAGFPPAGEDLTLARWPIIAPGQ